MTSTMTVPIQEKPERATESGPHASGRHCMPGARAVGGGYDDLVAQAVAKGRLAMLEPGVRARLLEGATVVQLPPRGLVAAGPAGIMLVVEGLLWPSSSPGTDGRSRCDTSGLARFPARRRCTRSPVKNEALTATTDRQDRAAEGRLCRAWRKAVRDEEF